MAVLSASTAADSAPGVEGDGGAEDCVQAAAGGKDKVVVGYWKEHSTLTHVIIRNAGHMVCPAHLPDSNCTPVTSVRTSEGLAACFAGPTCHTA